MKKPVVPEEKKHPFILILTARLILMALALAAIIAGLYVYVLVFGSLQ
jgi:hypothetical protein